MHRWVRFLRFGAALLGIVVGLAPVFAYAAPEGTGLPLPRFISLRADKAKLRTGPGVQYPEEWVYLRKALPLEVIAEHHTWRKVRDWQGTQGWMHQSLLSGSRTLIVTGTVRTIRNKPDTKSRAIARTEASVIGTILGCPEDTLWCRVEIGGHTGWLRKLEFWGAYKNEVVE